VLEIVFRSYQTPDSLDDGQEAKQAQEPLARYCWQTDWIASQRPEKNAERAKPGEGQTSQD
jgi:hypothetical protein